MTDHPSVYSYTPFFPPGPISKETSRKRAKDPYGEKPPRNPDWLVLFMSLLFLITLLIAWLVDIPALLR